MASVAASPPSPKLHLRQALKARRAAMPGEARQEADQSINHRLSKWLAAHPPQDLSFYLPLSGEVDVCPAVFEWCDQGGQICLPRVVAADQPLQFLGWAPGKPLVPGPFGTQEPYAQAPLVQPDVLVIPLLGFDLQGFRLGWGGGYYDRTLEHLRSRGTPTAIGVGYDLQAEEAVLADPWDQPMDIIMTESRMIEVGA